MEPAIHHAPAKRRGWGMLLSGIVLFIGSIAVPTVVLFVSIMSSIDSVQRHVFPGEAVIALEAETYTIFYEYRSMVDGQSYHTPRQLPAVNYRLIASDGEHVPLQPIRGSQSYEMGSFEASALFVIDVNRAGDYRLIAEYTNEPGPDFVLSIREGTFLDFFGSIMLIGCGGLVGVMIGLLLIILGIVRLVSTKTTAAHA